LFHASRRFAPLSSKVYFVTFDCPDPRALAGFWATVLSYEMDAQNEDAGEILLRDPGRRGPSLGFMKVPESKVVKNRVHLDLVVETSLEDEVERLVAAGATAVSTQQDPAGYVDRHIWAIMLDPEGNEFCVMQPLSARS
jgi:predicted enzyme related to lactoylglutathione lyase